MTTTIDLFAMATTQATALLFSTLGRYEGKLDQLLKDVNAAYALETTRGFEAKLDALDALFGQADSPKVRAPFDGIPTDLPSMYALMRDNLMQSLQVTFDAAPEASVTETLYRGRLMDWRVTDAESLDAIPAHHRTQFEIEVRQSKGNAFGIDIAEPDKTFDQLKGTLQLALNVDIDQGRPRVMLYNELMGDAVLTIYSTPEGFYLSPGQEKHCICTGKLDAASALGLLDRELNPEGERPSTNQAFMLTR